MGPLSKPACNISTLMTTDNKKNYIDAGRLSLSYDQTERIFTAAEPMKVMRLCVGV